jgi:hypothetical protein
MTTKFATIDRTRTAAAERLIRDLLALVGGATLHLDRVTGAVSLKPPGASRGTADELRRTLPAVLASAARLAELCGVDEDEVAGLRQFGAMIDEN